MDSNGAQNEVLYVNGNLSATQLSAWGNINLLSSGTGVGIGPASVGSVDATLAVKKNTPGLGRTTLLNLSNGVDSNLQVGISNTGESDKRAVLGPSTTTDLVLQTNSVERLRITSAGAVKLFGLTSNGFLKTSGSNGTLTVDANAYASTSNNLSAFAATTSAQLAGVLSDETGTGPAVFAASPSLTTPTLSSPTISGQITLPVTRTNLSGNVTLASTSSSYQFFDANGFDRIVTLPTAATGLSFVVYNFGSANTITVKDASANTVATVAPGNKFATVVYDGSAWRVF
jgi:hypothetical protein